MNLKKKARRRIEHERRIWKKRHGDLAGEILSVDVLNVWPVAKTRMTMCDAALSAFMRLRLSGQRNIKVSIGCDDNSTEIDSQNVASEMHRRWMQLAAACWIDMKLPNQMTQEEKFAICVAAKVPMKPQSRSDALTWRLETQHPCAITIEDGKYVVYQLPDYLV